MQLGLTFYINDSNERFSQSNSMFPLISLSLLLEGFFPLWFGSVEFDALEGNACSKCGCRSLNAAEV